ncbi:Aspartate/glutamate/uridylate kinase [Penicillium frequentans]|uniref:Aspartate/glutamate/uridylate kinase n=1 Tax=Penicillium frequentans TaxID=3151616 RepID=A0AAD6GII8_9EURO|nr:Aspartate/glutamate/uridylate kinase [Penicillium glabrum]KAJ5547006.1 Aspartate/glutamate/uridylate kinase [Penicillium glabrum]
MASPGLRIVIKLGTSSIVDEKTHEPILSILTTIVETVAKLRKDGHRVVLVSSGAVGVGLRRMDVDDRPTYLPRIQALAAVGQCRLMSLWDNLFSHLRVPVAQILLTRNDIADNTQYVNAQNTFEQLFDMGVIPIVNENDTLAVSEIKFGDNDTLSAITAATVKADYLFLMTDVDCLYTANPRSDPNAQPIEVVSDISTLEADVSSAGSALGTGGMSTKIVAAKLGTSAGVTTIITKSSKPGNVHEIVKYLQALQNIGNPDDVAAIASLPKPPLHTRFLPSDAPIQSRTFWLLHGLTPHGSLYIDHGAYEALLNKASLLPAGVLGVEGHFGQQEAVRLIVVDRPSPDALNGDFLHHSQEPREVGRAIVNYGSIEIAHIKGHRSTQIEALLGYADSDYVALRDNISFHPEDRHNHTVTPALTPALEEWKSPQASP